ncbi:MsnO8 family LLM class oxidoreductase [Chryseobacterium vrystaatense]|uniref:Luciferase family oxidoreductase, group 1 n=1 Tax=Chryseobacterium vrystaatense TaxID=307480 RepID=A0A1M5NIT1_9FLAO|nr:MsnO8 family LLM class oxidoreductase [Chryseobacterium vrystaatense]SHG89420.1 luciferase family oxidoreductase, group 1 [Chryseobacterium vrystaatense]
MKLKLGILDQSPTINGGSTLQALKNSIDLAVFADEAGFHKIIYSEHHGVEAYGSSSPEILSAIILSKTKRIKVGTGGIMMKNYSAYKIAEWTKMLGMLYPERFILGLGKAPGGLKDAVSALNNHRPVILTSQETKLEEIIRYIKEEKGIYDGLIAQPVELDYFPEILWLGSGIQSAREAATHGVGYSYADFMRNEQGTESTDLYLNEFSTNQYSPDRSLQVAVAASVAGDLQSARYNAYGMAYQFLQARHIQAPEALLPTEIIEKRIMGSDDEEEFFKILDHIIIDTPENISARLQEKREEYSTDELLILCNMYRETDRIYTYKTIIESNN